MSKIFCSRSCPLRLIVALVIGVSTTNTFAVSPSGEADTLLRIEVVPKTFELSGPREKLHPVVSGFYANGEVRDLTRVAQFSTSDSHVADVEVGVVRPLSNGETQVRVRVDHGLQRLHIPVRNRQVQRRAAPMIDRFQQRAPREQGLHKRIVPTRCRPMKRGTAPGAGRIDERRLLL